MPSRFPTPPPPAGSLLIKETLVIASATFNFDPRTQASEIWLQGSGGGGGGAQAVALAAAAYVATAAGGNGGSCGYGRYTRAQHGSSISITLGAAGTAGTNGGNGGTGNQSAVGALLVVNGALGGTGALITNNIGEYPVHWGFTNSNLPTVTGATFIRYGTFGKPGLVGMVDTSLLAATVEEQCNIATSGDGGDSFFGKGGRGLYAYATSGVNYTIVGANTGGAGYGFGGSGGMVVSINDVDAGTAGGAACCLIREYM